jgi:hypothetical protein
MQGVVSSLEQNERTMSRDCRRASGGKSKACLQMYKPKVRVLCLRLGFAPV